MLEEEKRAPTRREFSAKVSVLGLAAALFPALLSTPAHAAKPKKDGRFPAGVTGFTTTNTLDPALLDDIGYHFINWGLRNNLVEVDYKGEAIPELAESWEATSDAPWNNSHFHHARFDKLLKEARAERDQKKRAEMYFECQQIVRDEADGYKASERW